MQLKIIYAENLYHASSGLQILLSASYIEKEQEKEDEEGKIWVLYENGGSRRRIG